MKEMKLIILISSLLAVNAASFGSQRCTWGPAYWCDHPLKAKECGTEAVNYCIKNEWSKADVEDDSLCAECKTFIGEVKDVLNSGDIQTDVITMIKSLCDKLGSKAETCKEIVDLYGKELLEKLVTELDPSKVCTLFDLCQKASPAKTHTMVSLQVQADPCVDCKQIFDDLKDILSNATTQKFIFNELTMLCEMLGISADTCTNYINTYGPLVIDEALQFLDPDQICQAFGCKADSRSVNALMKKVTKTNADPCIDCKQIFSDLDDILGNKSVQQYFLKQVMQLCTELGLPDNVCQEVTLLGPEAFEYLIQLLNPDMICSVLGQCSSSVTERLSRLVQHVKKVPAANGDVCTECHKIFADLTDILSNQKVAQQLFNTLEKLCEDLGVSAGTCSQYINEYGTLVLDFFVSQLDSPAICTDLKLCAADRLSKLRYVHSIVQEVAQSNGDVCKECKEIISFLADILSNTTEQSYILMELVNVCMTVGVPADMCSSYINGYGPLVLSYIVEYLQPDQICTGAQLCVPSVDSVKPLLLTSALKVNMPALELMPAITVSDTKIETLESVEETADCTICKLIGDKLKELLQQPSTQQEIESALGKVCSLLPSSVQDSCDAVINQYTPEITDLLVTDFPPEYVCQLIELCSSPGVDQVKVSIECVMCEYVMDELDKMLKKNSTKTEIKDDLMKICSFLPTVVQTECDNFISANLDKIIEIIVTLGPDAVCDGLGVCKSADTIPQLDDIAVGDSVECLICDFVMSQLDSFLNKNTSEADIEKFLDNVCSLFSGATQDKCDNFIKKYTEDIINLLKNVPPSEVCQILKLCSASHQEQLQKQTPVGGADCGLCEQIAGYVELILKDGSTEKEIEDFLTSEVCSKLEGEMQTACLDVVDRYLPEMIQLITSMTPQSLCAVLGLCTSAPKVDSDAECMICQLIVKEMRSGLSQNATEVEIQKFLDMVCSKIPLSKYSSECRGFVDDYTKPIIQLLLSEMDPDQLCTSLGVCTTSKGVAVSNVQGGSLCLVCDIVFGIIDTQLELNKTTEEVTKLIENVCTVLPESLNKQCMSFLDLYGPMLLKVIVNSELEPNDICKEIKLCTALTRPKFGNGTSSCTACKEVVIAVEAFINANEDAVVDEIAKVCDLLPAADQQECKNYIEVYGPYILDLLKEEIFTPSEICQVFKMCPKSLEGLLMPDPCKFGPTYWCASKQRAIKCGAVEHCNRHVWN